MTPVLQMSKQIVSDLTSFCLCEWLNVQNIVAFGAVISTESINHLAILVEDVEPIALLRLLDWYTHLLRVGECLARC